LDNPESKKRISRKDNTKIINKMTNKISIAIKSLLFISTIISCFFCAERERLNPIDPQNSETGGKPQGLRIYSEYEKAFLTWDNIKLTDFLGYRVYRKTKHGSEFELLYLTPKDSNCFVDKHLSYEQRYTYRISVLANDFESNFSDTVTIIPGPTLIWLSDVYSSRLIKLSHDCAHEISSFKVDGYPWTITHQETNGNLWYSDVLLNRIYKFKDKQQPTLFADLSNHEPIDFVIDEKKDRIWVADELNGNIFIFNTLGDTLKRLQKFEKPVDIDCYSADGSCWVADAKKRSVSKISSDFNIVTEIFSMNSPAAVSVNQTTGEIWAADKSKVFKFDENGNNLLTIDSGLNYPFKVAVDFQLGCCWVLDWYFKAQESRLICFSENGEILVDLSGFSFPENLIINPYDHTCIVADSQGDKVIKVNLNGTIYGEISGYDYPYGLDVVY